MTADVVVLGSFMMDLVVRAPRRPAAGETLVGTGFDAVPRRQGLQPGHRRGAGPERRRRWSVGWATTTTAAASSTCLAGEGIDAGHVVVDPDEGTGIGDAAGRGRPARTRS